MRKHEPQPRIPPPPGPPPPALNRRLNRPTLNSSTFGTQTQTRAFDSNPEVDTIRELVK